MCVCIRDSGRDCYRAFFFSLPLLARAAPATVAHGVSRRVPKPAAMGPRCRWRARQSSREKEFYYSPVPRVVREKEFSTEDKYPHQLTLTFTQLSPFSFDCPLIARAARSRWSSWVEGGCSGGRQRDGGKQKPEMCSGTGVRDHGPRRGVPFGE